MTPVLETRAVSKTFGGNTAVSGVSLAIGAGEIVALVGPNGAGKTTLLNLITGQYVADDGTVLIEQADVTRLRPSHRLRAPVFRSYQSGGAFGKLRALDNVAIAAAARGTSPREARAKAGEALAAVGLTALADYPAERLSGGQRKLIDFARLLVATPRVLLLDEPTSGVSPSLCAVMTRLVRAQQAAGIASLVVSHDLAWVFALCDRVVVLAAGRVLATGTPDEVRADPKVVEAYLA
jgi:branched-chain amino acid transport system ATP-binding protein